MGTWRGEHYEPDAPPVVPAPAGPAPVPARAGGRRAGVPVAEGVGFAPLPSDPLDMSPARSLAGGRLTVDTSTLYLGSTRVILPPPDAESQWRQLSLDDDTLDRMSPQDLIQLLADLSPEVSRALYDALRLLNPGWEATCLRPGTEEQDSAAQAVLDAFIAHLHDLYGTIDVVIGRLFIAAFLRGALFAELVLDETGRVPVDLATPDPATVRFRRQSDPVRGDVWELGQWQLLGFTPLTRPTVRYVPVDPFPGSPYGRALAAPAVFTALFLLGLLHDLRRVVAQQGYPRLDVSVNMERLKASMPTDAANNPQVWQQWVDAIISEVQTQFRFLQPDDTFVHADIIEVNRPVGTVDSSSLGAVDGLITALERMLTRALKSMPLMMGLGQTATETASNREWEIHVQGIKSLQHLAESLLERLMMLALQAQGIATEVRWHFAENRAAELLRDQQVAALTIDNAMKTWAYGFTSMDESAQMAVGHPANAKEPRALFKGESLVGQNAPGTTQADPGSSRKGPLRVVGEE